MLILTYCGKAISLIPASCLTLPLTSYISVWMFSFLSIFLMETASPFVSEPSVISTSLFFVSSSKTDIACLIADSIFVFSFSTEAVSKLTLTYSSVGKTVVTALPPNTDTAVLSPFLFSC